MSPFVRWAKFNLVGAMGMVVQLGALAVLKHWMRGHYLAASAVALELAVLHNFAWHVRYTWADERCNGTLAGQLWRFYLSNGLVSLLGSLALVRLLVAAAHLPLLAANLIAIACCSVVNFSLAHRWAFRRVRPTTTLPEPANCVR